MGNFYFRYGKRLLDVLLVMVVAVSLSWLIVIIIIAYMVTFEFPVLFRHCRIGKGREHFTLYKFRTLAVDEAKPLGERRFLLGNFLRITNLDELPQLWNVWKGEMSLVGPRPLPAAYENLFSADQHKRHTVLPGITGLAQVSGKNTLAWDEKFKLDLEYTRHISLRLDSIILFKTFILAVSFKRDVSLEEKKFTG